VSDQQAGDQRLQHLEAARLAAKRWPKKFVSCEVCREVVEGVDPE